jgi:hypothetical protein
MMLVEKAVHQFMIDHGARNELRGGGKVIDKAAAEIIADHNVVAQR